MTEALLSADALAGDGRWREAIALLTDEQRRAPRHQIAHRLVEMRHAAFAHAAVEPSGGPPVAGPGPTPAGSPPEVTGDELSVDVLARSIRSAGCLLVRGLLPPHRVALLTADIDCAFAAYDLEPPGRAGPDRVPWYDPFVPGPGFPPDLGRGWVREGGGILAVDSPPTLYDLVESMRESGVVAVVSGYLGCDPVSISAKKTTLRIVPPDTNTGWHQDGAFLGADIRAMNVWLALSSCGGDEDAPGLEILPRRLDEIVPTGTAGAIFDWVAAPDRVEHAAQGVPIVRPRFEPGDVLLFDHMFMHRTGAMPGLRRSRHAVEMWFFAPSHYPEAHPPLVVYS